MKSKPWDLKYSPKMSIEPLLFVSPGGRSLADAHHNRDYVVSKVSSEIHEIIRVLQLTTYDEDEWDADDITVMKKAQVRILKHREILL